MDRGGALAIQNDRDVMMANPISPWTVPRRQVEEWRIAAGEQNADRARTRAVSSRSTVRNLAADFANASGVRQRTAAGRRLDRAINRSRIGRQGYIRRQGARARQAERRDMGRYEHRSGTRNYNFTPKYRVKFHKQVYIKPTNYINKRYKKRIFKAKAKYGPYDAGWYHGGRAPYEGYSQGTFIF